LKGNNSTATGVKEDRTSIKLGKGQGSQHVYDILKQEILSLKLRPSEMLDEKALVERFSLSRSPIREAISRLAAEGLVVTISNRGTKVAPLDLDSFPHYVEALDLLQRINTRLAAQNRQAHDIEAMKRDALEFENAVRSGDRLQMSISNKQFHMTIAAAGRNPYLILPYERLLNEGRRILHLHFEYLESSSDDDLLTTEHDDIIEAIVAKNIEAADSLAHAHTRQFRDRFIEFLQNEHAEVFNLQAPS
jgi:DNA-binding GntR family transcriptional regulator